MCLTSLPNSVMYNMKHIVSTFIALLFAGFYTEAQTIKSLAFSEIESEIKHYDGEFLIVNYWATWCRPCVEELPDFEKINDEFGTKGTAVWLINLDFSSAIDKKVKPFIQKHNLKSKLFHIKNTDPNEWINKVDESWGGNIPVTVIYHKGQKIHFWARSTNYEEMHSVLTKTY